MKYVKFSSSFLLLFSVIYFLNTKIAFLADSALGNLPPLGRFLDPFQGFWHNAEPVKPLADLEAKIPGIIQPVTVYYDQQMVPHIFAANNHDLYFVQGYITARDRLWQMEFQTLAAAGRISEVIGAKARNYDRLQRRKGMCYGAEKSLKVIMANPVSRETVLAFTAGINAWISQLRPGQYPVEYKLLDYSPEPWTPLKVSLLQQSLAATLTGETDAASMTADLQKFGPAVMTDLFPDVRFIESPVIPAGTPWNFKKLIPSGHKPANAGPTSQKPGSQNSANAGLARESSGAQEPVAVREHADGIGSNNWAVDGTKTADHHTLLANDPHLTLSLPSIWYQIQLNAPGINVYGVSLPGAPGIVVGFNEHIAWGVTNVGADVLDIYHLSWTSPRHDAYLVDGKTVPVSRRIETILVRGLPAMYDTVTYTRYGPVVYDRSFNASADIPADHAMRWLGHDASNEVRSIYLLNRATSYAEFTSALTDFTSPAQNFAYADDKGHIAQWVNGSFSLKYKDQGKYILDGSKTLNDWGPLIPHDQVPHILDPARHYIASANQSSTDTTYPYYLNWNFENTQRAMRINQLLQPMKNATPETMRLMQTDQLNEFARLILPDLLKNLKMDRLTGPQREAFMHIKSWKYENSSDAIAPAIFDMWQKNLTREIWDEFDAPGLHLPSRDRTIHLLLYETRSPWFDDKRTPIIESKADIISSSFRRAVDSLVKHYGKAQLNWKWGAVKGTAIRHLLNIDAFSREKLQLGGGAGIIDALTARTGPSWRMVVEPGQANKAYGVFPGGQSGNPGSFFYDNLIDYWAQGRLYQLVFMKTEADNQQIITRLMLTRSAQ